MNFLDEIIKAKHAELHTAKQMTHESALRHFASLRNTPCRGFEASLRQEGIRVVTEIKRASPSKGDIRPGIDPAETAKAYEAGGAAALSILTEHAFFKGSVSDLVEARKAVGIPVLRKDFIIDSYQVHESYMIGADAILLIVRILDDHQLISLYALARSYGLDVLTEVYDEADLNRALAIGATCIGINNRDLSTFETDPAKAVELAAKIPASAIAVALSGIAGKQDIEALSTRGLSRFLVGEALMRHDDPAALLREMISCGVPHD